MASRLRPVFRPCRLLPPSSSSPAGRLIPLRVARLSSSLSQRPDASHVRFPGAINSAFTTTLSVRLAADTPALDTYRAIDPMGQVVDQSFEPDLNEADTVRHYEAMVLVQIMDGLMLDAQRQGRISFYVVSAGEEAVCAGSASALTLDDVVFCQYREQAMLAQRGFTVDDFMSQLFANRNDVGLGRNMPVHYGSRKLNVAAGAAYSLKMQRAANPSLPPRVVTAYFGEGAASEGDFHAALNMAATRSCPVIFICRNNGYAISTPALQQYRGDGIASRGIGYGIDTIRVDGNDFWAVRAATRLARRIALGEATDSNVASSEGSAGVAGSPSPSSPSSSISTASGATKADSTPRPRSKKISRETKEKDTKDKDLCRPVLIEALTYRVSHHSTSDDSFAYRARSEVDDWKRRDNPIARLRRWMEARGWWDDAKEDEARARLRRDLLTAFARAEREKKPPIRSMFDGVYDELTVDLREQMAHLRAHMDRYPDEYDVSNYVDGKASLGVGGVDSGDKR